MAMPKRLISLTEPQLDFLKAEAARLGISIGDLVRRIVDEYRTGREP